MGVIYRTTIFSNLQPFIFPTAIAISYRHSHHQLQNLPSYISRAPTDSLLPSVPTSITNADEITSSFLHKTRSTRDFCYLSLFLHIHDSSVAYTRIGDRDFYTVTHRSGFFNCFSIITHSYILNTDPWLSWDKTHHTTKPIFRTSMIVWPRSFGFPGRSGLQGVNV